MNSIRLFACLSVLFIFSLNGMRRDTQGQDSLSLKWAVYEPIPECLKDRSPSERWSLGYGYLFCYFIRHGRLHPKMEKFCGNGKILSQETKKELQAVIEGVPCANVKHLLQNFEREDKRAVNLWRWSLMYFTGIQLGLIETKKKQVGASSGQLSTRIPVAKVAGKKIHRSSSVRTKNMCGRVLQNSGTKH